MSRVISISSSDRSRGSINNFTVKFVNPVTDVRRIKSMQVSLPYTWYTVMAGINDKIYITVTGPTTYSATLTEGNYTNTQLWTETATQINAAYTPDNLFTVTENTTTRKVTVTHGTTNFQLTFAANTTASARKLLGFNATDTTAGTSSLAPNIYNLTGDNTLFIKSRALSLGNAIIGNERASIILPVPVTGSSGNIISFRSLGETWDLEYFQRDGKTFDEIDLALYFEDLDTLVPMNGHDWRISFQYVRETTGI